MNDKMLPQRRCIGCMKSFDKNSLFRIVKQKDGSFCFDKNGKLDGRGAYICKSKACFDIARKRKKLEYAFKCKIPDEIYDELKGELEKIE